MFKSIHVVICKKENTIAFRKVYCYLHSVVAFNDIYTSSTPESEYPHVAALYTFIALFGVSYPTCAVSEFEITTS